jgi:hypothetical protein
VLLLCAQACCVLHSFILTFKLQCASFDTVTVLLALAFALMRLLRREHDGQYILTTFDSGAIPRYAILSHTWGAATDEVTFRDFIENKYKDKVGFNKIRFCADQALKDGLEYFWVDTCCINKLSSAELDGAINSMFKWYSKSKECYVYLSDVASDRSLDGSITLQDSRWFTRGWTLQELIAPSLVEFFTVDGQKLGDKRSMAQQLHSNTHISLGALLGAPLSSFTVDERLSWMRKRQTKEEEDAVYALVGIFDVSLSSTYGEDYAKALHRLKRGIKDLNDDISPMRSGKRVRVEPFSTIPFAPDPRLVERPEIMEWIREKCRSPGARVALVGLGGIG